MTVSKRRRFAVLTRDRFTCRYCGRSAPAVELHVDHVHPVSLGGCDDESNLVTACVECNLSKMDKLLPCDPPKPGEKAPTSAPIASNGLVDHYVLAPKPITSFCDECDKPRSSWRQGKIVEEPHPSVFLVQWFEWGFGEPTHRDLVALGTMLDEKWLLFGDQDSWGEYCRGIICEHDHDHHMRWASYGESEPARRYPKHPGYDDAVARQRAEGMEFVP